MYDVDEIKDDIKQLSEHGGEIHLLSTSPTTGASSTHTHVKVKKGTKIVCGHDFLKIYYDDSPERLCFMTPYSSISYIFLKK